MKRPDDRQRGLTLVELLLSLALFSFLAIAIFQILDRSLSLWRRTETRRALLGQAAAVSELLAEDLVGLEGGTPGDLVAEWVVFDTDGDGVGESKWPRLRLVRQASAGDVQRLQARRREEGDGAAPPRPAEGLVEVLWLVVPASLTDKDARAEGVLWRGERLATDAASKSFFAPDFLGRSGRPPAGAADEVGGGILWFGMLFATQTSSVHDGWRVGPELDCTATSWDAWARSRPEKGAHPWNEPGAGMPRIKNRPLLPRRVRIELELERPSDRARRTALAAPVEVGDAGILVDDGERIPREEDSFVLVDSEWMRVRSIDGRTVAVDRGQRGTRTAMHAAGSRVHYGLRIVREVPIATYREDWNL